MFNSLGNFLYQEKKVFASTTTEEQATIYSNLSKVLDDKVPLHREKVMEALVEKTNEQFCNFLMSITEFSQDYTVQLKKKFKALIVDSIPGATTADCMGDVVVNIPMAASLELLELAIDHPIEPHSTSTIYDKVKYVTIIGGAIARKFVKNLPKDVIDNFNMPHMDTDVDVSLTEMSIIASYNFYMEDMTESEMEKVVKIMCDAPKKIPVFKELF